MTNLRITAVVVALMASAPIVASDSISAAPATEAAATVDPNMWDLGELYASPQAWTAEHDRLKAVTDTLVQYKGTLGKSAKSMLTALDAMSAVQRADARLAAYAGLKADEDVRIAANQERQQLAAALATQFSEKTAWVTPELIAKVKANIRDA